MSGGTGTANRERSSRDEDRGTHLKPPRCSAPDTRGQGSPCFPVQAPQDLARAKAVSPWPLRRGLAGLGSAPSSANSSNEANMPRLQWRGKFPSRHFANFHVPEPFLDREGRPPGPRNEHKSMCRIILRFSSRSLLGLGLLVTGYKTPSSDSSSALARRGSRPERGASGNRVGEPARCRRPLGFGSLSERRARPRVTGCANRDQPEGAHAAARLRWRAATRRPFAAADAV